MSNSIEASERLTGRSIIGGLSVSEGGSPFFGYTPADGRELEPVFLSATPQDVDRAVTAAVEAAAVYAGIPATERGRLLRAIADGIDAASVEVVERAHLETALPRPRLTGEVARTSGQLRLFASVVEEGSWVMARIDTANPERTPPKPDIRSMLRPLGPVAIFGASNFPLAFSVAGGDTASALAAGNPVIVKAHPAHPGTSELVGRIVADAIHSLGLPAGIFSLLFDEGYEVGAALVQHPEIRAVGFTGSFRGGRALMDLAAKRTVPIPVYAEMGSINPVFLLSGTLAESAKKLARGLHASFTLGGGQFCTKPGVVFVEASQARELLEELRALTAAGPAFSLLTGGIAAAYRRGVSARYELQSTDGGVASEGFGAQPVLLETTGSQYFTDETLSHEVFGPTVLVVLCESRAVLLRAADALDGQLTATVHGTDSDLHDWKELLQVLATKAGRLIVNGFPTGVEVCHAMVHGGPYPATLDGRSTSVGSQAIFRFARPVAYQGLPQWALPLELQDANPLGVPRLRDGVQELPAR